MAIQDPWVMETRFGNWFQATSIWNRYVLGEAIESLSQLLAAASAPTPPHPQILDAGCGIGAAFPFIEQHLNPAQIVAIDIDSEMVLAAEAAALTATCPVEVRQANVEKLPFADGSFDIVLCHQTVHHVSHQVAAVHELHRVLKPGGILLFAESCRRFIHSLPVRLLFRHPRGVQKTAAEYAGLLESAGFELSPDQMCTPEPFWSKPDLGLMERLGLRKQFHGEPTQINIVARRPA